MKRAILIALLSGTTAFGALAFFRLGGRIIELERNLSWYLREDQNPIEARQALLRALERPYRGRSRESLPVWFREDPRGSEGLMGGWVARRKGGDREN